MWRRDDEAEWFDIAHSVLSLALELETPVSPPAVGDFEILDIRNQRPLDRFLRVLPWLWDTIIPDTTIPAKDFADLALGFQANTPPRVGALRKAATKADPDNPTPLSHSADLATSSIPLQCAVAAKKPEANERVAQAQLAAWQASAILHAGHLLREGTRHSWPLPRNAFPVGWLAMGYRWELFFTEQLLPDGIACIGPILPGPLGTRTKAELYRLIAALRSLIKWLKTDYWETFDYLYRRSAGIDYTRLPGV